MDNYPKHWNLFAFYGIFKEHSVREMNLKSRRKDYRVITENWRVDDWVKTYDFGAATIEPQEGGVLLVDVVALSPEAEQHVDFVEGVQHGWYAKRWARELFGYTWLGLNEPEIDCYVYQMNITPEREEYRNDAHNRAFGTATDYDIGSPS